MVGNTRHRGFHAAADVHSPGLEDPVLLAGSHFHRGVRDPEHRLVERQRRIRFVRDQFVPDDRTRLVDQGRADVLVGLPQPHDCSGRVGDERHPAGVADVEGRHHYLAARGTHVGDRRVDVVHRDVRVPRRRHPVRGARWHRRDSGHGFSVQRRHRVHAPVARGLLVVVAPPEQRGIELLAGRLISGLQVDPTRRALRVLGFLWHDWPFVYSLTKRTPISTLLRV